MQMTCKKMICITKMVPTHGELDVWLEIHTSWLVLCVCVFALLNGKGERKCVCSLSGMTMMHLYFQDTFIEKTDHPMEDVGGHRIDTPTQRAYLAD